MAFSFLKKQAYRYSFLAIFPLFFVLHSINEFNMGLPSIHVFLLLFYYILGGLIVTALNWLLFRNMEKASICTVLIMAYFFFFGILQDFLKETLHLHLVTKYTVLLPVSFLVFAGIYVFVKKTKWSFRHFFRYLHILFLILILLDLVQIIYKESKMAWPGKETLSQIRPADANSLPDIHLIIADEYPGKKQLKDQFDFDNRDFEHELSNRGFRVLEDTRSNYNFTMYSMASLLNMEYLPIEGNWFQHGETFPCRRWIKHNAFTKLLEQKGYAFYNHSFFDLKQEKKAVYNHYFLRDDKYINRQTLIGRINFHLGFHFVSRETIRNIEMNDHFNNLKAASLTHELVQKESKAPRFVYTHLSLPHGPYYYDRHGKPLNQKLDKPEDFKKAFPEYVLYSNQQLLKLVDRIQQSSRPSIIMLMGDHGFRQFVDPASRPYHFINLNAVYFPDRNTSGFYNGMTNVNQFRILLNKVFAQELPLLKDSTIFLGEKGNTWAH